MCVHVYMCLHAGMCAVKQQLSRLNSLFHVGSGSEPRSLIWDQSLSPIEISCHTLLSSLNEHVLYDSTSATQVNSQVWAQE